MHHKATTSEAERGRNTPIPAHGHPSRTPTGSNHHSTAETRCVTSHVQGHRRPGIARHDAYATTTYRTQKDHNSCPAAETPSPAHRAGTEADAQLPPRPAHSAGIGTKAAATHNPANPVGAEQSANTLNTVYHLKLDLPTRAITTCDARNDCRGRTIDDLPAQPHVAPGPARRADHSDQGILASRCPSSVEATYPVVPDAHAIPHIATQAKCRRCAFCGRPHWSARCTIYATAKKRFRRLEQLNQCFICLGRSHSSGTCPLHAKDACEHCHQGQHHVALCHGFVPRSTTETALSVAPDTSNLPHAAPKATCRMCAFCDKPHPSTGCKTYRRVSHRTRRLRALKRCFLCLEEGHTSNECSYRKTSPCRHCNRGQHHLALCRSLQGDATAAESTSLPTAELRTTAFPHATHPVAREAGPTRRNAVAGTFPSALNHFRRKLQSSATTRSVLRVAHRPANKRSAAVPTSAQAPSSQPSRPRPAAGTFPPAMNHFRRELHSSATTKSVPRVAHRPAKKRSAAVPTSAQPPSSHLSRPRHNRTATRSLGNQHLVHALNAAGLSRMDHATSSKTSIKKRTKQKSNSSPTHPVGKETRNRAPHGEKSSKTSITQQKSNSSPTHPVGKETRNRASHGEKTEHPSRDAKTHRRSQDHPQEPLAITPARTIQHADVRCELCTQRHRAERCTFFSSTEKRRQRAQYLWLCFTCLAEDHRTEDCPNARKSSCSYCSDGSHHQALCAETCRQATDLAEAYSTPVVAPAETHQRPLTPRPGEDPHRSETPTPMQSSTGRAVLAVPAEDRQQEPTMAQERRALQRQNRELKKRRN